MTSLFLYILGSFKQHGHHAGQIINMENFNLNMCFHLFVLCQSFWQVEEFAQHLKVSEIMTTGNFQEAAALLQKGLVSVKLVRATHDAVESALQRIHGLIYPNSQPVVPPHQIQQSSVQAAEDLQDLPQVKEGSESELEILDGPDPELALEDPSENEKTPQHELSQAEVEDLMQAEVTKDNMELQIRIMMQILNKEIPTPKCFAQETEEVAKTKLPKRMIRNRGRILLIKASMMKGKGFKSAGSKDTKSKGLKRNRDAKKTGKQKESQDQQILKRSTHCPKSKGIKGCRKSKPSGCG